MKTTNYSDTIANAIKTFLETNDWHFTFDEEKGGFTFGLGMKGQMKKINYIIRVHEDDYILYATAPIGADTDDPDMMLQMAEFICRANYGLRCGNFELDMRDGEIRYKCFVDCDGIIPTSEMVERSVHVPAGMFNRYAPGILSIIFGGASAKDAVEKCENNLG